MTQKKNIKFVTRDNQTVQVDPGHQLVSMSEFVSTLYEDGDLDTEEVKLMEIDSDVLNLVIQFCEKGPRELLTKPILTDRYVNEVREWELEFFEALDFEKVQELLLASDFLNNEVLTDAWSAYIAYKLKQTAIEKLENTYETSTNISKDEELRLMAKYKVLITQNLEEYESAIS